MTADERALLLLLARMTVGMQRKTPYFDQMVKAAIARLEEEESRKRDHFVAKILRGSTDALVKAINDTLAAFVPKPEPVESLPEDDIVF